MAAKIRLKRTGKKGRPEYRIVIQDTKVARKGKEVEIIGTYNPLVEPSLININKEKALEWVKKGASPTFKVRVLLGKAGILPEVNFEGMKKRAPKVKGKKEEGAAAPVPAATAEAKPKAEAKPAVKEEAKAEAQPQA